MDWTGNRKRIKDEFRSRGYVVIREFLNSQGVEELRREIERYTRDVVPRIYPRDVYCEVKDRLDTIKQLIRMSEYDDYFRKLILSERYVSLAELLLDGSVVGKNMQWFNKPREVGRATPLHQDGYYFMLEPNAYHVVGS